MSHGKIATCLFLGVLGVSAGLARGGDRPGAGTEQLFAKGQPFYTEMTTATKMSLNVMSMNYDSTVEETLYIQWTPELYDRRAQTWILKQRIQAIKVVVGKQVTFDSTKVGDGGQDALGIWRSIVGAEFTITLGPDLAVRQVDWAAALVERLAGMNPGVKPVVEALFSGQALRDMVRATLPGMPAKAGKSWTEVHDMMLSISGWKASYVFTRAEKEGALDRIKVAGSVTWSPPPGKPWTGLGSEVKKVKLGKTKITGMLVFDRAKHRIDHSEMTHELEGKIAAEIGGTASTFDLSQTYTIRVRVTDKNPIPDPMTLFKQRLAKNPESICKPAPELVVALKDPDLEVRRKAAQVVARLAPQFKTTPEECTAALKEGDPEVRSWVAIGLGRFDAEAGVDLPVVLTALKDRDHGVRSRAADVLGCMRLGTDVPVAVLADLLRQGDNDVRASAATLLSGMGPAAAVAVPSLVAALKDQDLVIRGTARVALRRIGRPAAPALDELLKDKDRDTRVAALSLLGGMGPGAKDTVPAVVEALSDKDELVRTVAGQALRKIDPAGAAKERK